MALSMDELNFDDFFHEGLEEFDYMSVDAGMESKVLH
jgi:hypothetical protein